MRSLSFALAYLLAFYCVAKDTMHTYEYYDLHRIAFVPMTFSVDCDELFFDSHDRGLVIQKVVQDAEELMPDSRVVLSSRQNRLIGVDADFYTYWVPLFWFACYDPAPNSDSKLFFVTDDFTILEITYFVLKRSIENQTIETERMDGPYKLTIRRRPKK